MTEKGIFIKLNEMLRKLLLYYPPENVFIIFVTEIDDNNIEAEAVVIPTFDQICTGTSEVRGQYHINDNVLTILDIRLMYEATKNGYPEAIEALDNPYKIINPVYEHIFNKLYVANKDAFKNGIITGEPAEELRIAIMKLCRHCWNETSNSVKFIKQLTDAEKLGLEGIIKAINDEGTISQAKVASAVGVSRLTMTNLVEKMKLYEIADVVYMGNKGTYIKILDDIALDIRGIR